MNYSIRPAQSSDVHAAQALLGELIDFQLPLQTHLVPWKDVRPAYWDWLQAHLTAKSGFMYIAEADAEPVGLMACWIDEDDYPAMKSSERNYGFVGELVVSDGARNCGVGTALLKKAEEVFLEKGVKIMKLTTFANNRLADDFYANYGMQRNIITYKKYLGAEG